MNKPEVKAQTGLQTQTVPKKINRDELAKQIKRMRDRDSELVTGVFQNLENRATACSTGATVFSYKFYPNDDNVIYELLDGERYTLPRGVARHLNNNCYYKEYQHLKNPFGEEASVMRTAVSPDGRLQTKNIQQARKVHRYAFHSLEYMDDDFEMYPSNLVEVTAVL